MDYLTTLEVARAVVYGPLSNVADAVKDPRPDLPYSRRVKDAIANENIWLTFDESVQALRPFILPRRYLGLGDVVPPEQWHLYRELHSFHAPSCLCPLLYEDVPAEFRPSFECRIWKFTPGKVSSVAYWTAACSTGNCSYFVVNFPKFFASQNQPSAAYPVRPHVGRVGLLIPPMPAYHHTTAPDVGSSTMVARPLKRSNAVIYVDADNAPAAASSSQPAKKSKKGKGKAVLPTVPLSDAFRDVIATVADSDKVRALQLFHELDRQGLLPFEFNRIMMICPCGLMMSREAYQTTHVDVCNGQQVAAPTVDIFADIPVANAIFDKDEYALLLKLDNHVDPGLPLDRARMVIVRCECTRYMTRTTFESNTPASHHCEFKPMDL